MTARKSANLATRLEELARARARRLGISEEEALEGAEGPAPSIEADELLHYEPSLPARRGSFQPYPTPNCISAAEVEFFLSGEFPAPLQEHVATCAGCQGLLLTLWPSSDYETAFAEMVNEASAFRIGGSLADSTVARLAAMAR